MNAHTRLIAEFPCLRKLITSTPNLLKWQSYDCWIVCTKNQIKPRLPSTKRWAAMLTLSILVFSSVDSILRIVRLPGLHLWQFVAGATNAQICGELTWQAKLNNRKKLLCCKVNESGPKFYGTKLKKGWLAWRQIHIYREKPGVDVTGH